MRAARWALGFEIFRGRYIDGFDKPRALTAGKVRELQVRPAQRRPRVSEGHRIMVQVQSTLFPLYDRNPQMFVPQHLQTPDQATTGKPRRASTATQWPPARCGYQSWRNRRNEPRPCCKWEGSFHRTLALDAPPPPR